MGHAEVTQRDGTPLAAVSASLHKLTAEIGAYMETLPPSDRYMPPIIDWHKPDEYRQTGIAGLSKFHTSVLKEQAIVDAMLSSPRPPSDYSSNLVAHEGVWEAFLRAPRPLVGISQSMDRKPSPGLRPANKIDVVCEGGDLWIKVNNIKESRLMVELREQDSYMNSDYDSDESEAKPPLTNSLLAQARSLLASARAHQRPAGRAPPRIRCILTRLEEHPAKGHRDPRIPATFDAMRALGIELEFADTCRATPVAPTPLSFQPSPDIVLDLSVIIALCCDSTHYPLPRNTEELEARFRMPRINDSGEIELAPHKRTTSDLRNQLRHEMARPLVFELQSRLEGCEPRFWCTREVYERLPGLVNVIGGEQERQRGQRLFDPSAGPFWEGSRWEGKAGCLENLVVRVLDDDAEIPEPELSPFDTLVKEICEAMIVTAASDESSPSTRSATPTSVGTAPTPTPPKSKQAKHRNHQSKNPLRPGTYFPPSTRLPSAHTLRTMLAGVRRGATVLTNNRGAVLKVLREAGVFDGIPPGDRDDTRARIWVVNPSSLAEWRRLEVERAHERVQAELAAGSARVNGHKDDDGDGDEAT